VPQRQKGNGYFLRVAFIVVKGTHFPSFSIVDVKVL
jgi:hypothetical protein